MPAVRTWAAGTTLNSLPLRAAPYLPPEEEVIPVTPQHFTLVADTEKVFTLDQNCGMIRIVVVANPAVIYFNTKNVAVPAVATSQDGNQVIPGVLAVVEVQDETAGGNSIVRVRSAGTPTVMVTGW